MIDFSKLLDDTNASNLINPLEIYETIDRKSDVGPLRPAQEYVLTEWHTNRRNDRDLILKLHTGQGKTIVGLLILQSLLNDGKGPALYLCPNKYLVDQTCAQAKRFGIKVLNGNDSEDIPQDFSDSESIYVCTVQKLFNGMSKFGLRADSTEVGAILMDDCHACIDSIKQACSINIKSNTQAYRDLLNLFNVELQEQGAGTFEDILSGEHDSLLPVPYWNWIDRKSEVTEVLGKHKSLVQSIKFAWPILKDMMEKCSCVFSGASLEISPTIAPLQVFGSYFKAKHRIFMSATITDDSFLVKGLRISKETIKNPLVYPNEKWFGEKMVLIPSLIDGEVGRSSIIQKFASPQASASYGIVGLCPSEKLSKIWSESGAEVATKDDVLAKVKGLLSGSFNKAVCLVNRYDGIDLPDASCRVLVLDSKPFNGGLIDKYIESCRPGSNVTAQRIARVIEQGLGRGVRGEKDYCAVIVVGGDLVRTIQRKDVKKYFSSQTTKQISIGMEIIKVSQADRAHGISGVDITEKLVQQLLQRDDGWKKFYNNRMSGVKLDGPNDQMLNLFSLELEAELKAEAGQHTVARKLIQDMLDKDTSMISEDRGWYTQEMARLIYGHSKSDSAALQSAAHRVNGYLLKPKVGLAVKKLEPMSQKRVQAIIDWVSKEPDHDSLILRVRSIADQLRFGVNSDTFEQSIDELGQALGFSTERPDKIWGSGPDNLWCMKAGTYILIECKNQVKTSRDEIAKTETGQINNSHAWFTKNYPGAAVDCIMVIPTNKLGEGAGFNMTVEILQEKGLKKLARNLQSFFMEFLKAELTDLDQKNVHHWLKVHDLEISNLFSSYSSKVIDS